MKSLLIVRLGAVGDGLLLAPALAALRQVFPSARIDVAGAVFRLRLLAGPTLADAVRPIEDFFRDGRARSEELRLYDRIVVFATNLDDPMLRDLERAAPDRVALHASFPVGRASDHHVIDHIQRAFSTFSLQRNGDRRYRIPVPEPAQRFADEFLASAGGQGPRVYLIPGTRIATKCWPAERFVELCRKLVEHRGCRVFLNSGPSDEKTVGPIERGLSGTDFVAARGMDLVRLGGVLARMDLCIGVDCGITHLAGLVGAPTLALFGPTRPELWGPVGPRVRVLVGSRGLACCADDHPRTCEGGCMERISVANVLAAAEEELSLLTRSASG